MNQRYNQPKHLLWYSPFCCLRQSAFSAIQKAVLILISLSFSRYCRQRGRVQFRYEPTHRTRLEPVRLILSLFEEFQLKVLVKSKKVLFKERGHEIKCFKENNLGFQKLNQTVVRNTVIYLDHIFSENIFFLATQIFCKSIFSIYLNYYL